MKDNAYVIGAVMGMETLIALQSGAEKEARIHASILECPPIELDTGLNLTAKEARLTTRLILAAARRLLKEVKASS
jgi:hypothetical protein